MYVKDINFADNIYVFNVSSFKEISPPRANVGNNPERKYELCVGLLEPLEISLRLLESAIRRVRRDRALEKTLHTQIFNRSGKTGSN